MPKTIPCWDCKGRGTQRVNNNIGGYLYDIKCPPCNGGGVLSVYTQAEVQEVRTAYEHYIDLLGAEISDLVGIANVHGWKSKRFFEGVNARATIGKIEGE